MVETSGSRRRDMRVFLSPEYVAVLVVLGLGKLGKTLQLHTCMSSWNTQERERKQEFII